MQVIAHSVREHDITVKCLFNECSEVFPGYGLMDTLSCASLRYVHTFKMWCFYLHLKFLANNILSKNNPNTETQFDFELPVSHDVIKIQTTKLLILLIF